MIKEIIKAIEGCISKIEIAEEARPSENFTRAKNNLDRAIEYLEAEKPTTTSSAGAEDNDNTEIKTDASTAPDESQKVSTEAQKDASGQTTKDTKTIRRKPAAK